MIDTAPSQADASVTSNHGLTNESEEAGIVAASDPSWSMPAWMPNWAVTAWRAIGEEGRQWWKWGILLMAVVSFPMATVGPTSNTSWFWFLGIFVGTAAAAQLERGFGIWYRPKYWVCGFYLLMFITSLHPFGAVDLDFEVKDSQTRVWITNVVGSYPYRYYNVEGKVRFVRSTGECRDFTFEWAKWNPGETKYLSIPTPFPDFERVDFSALNTRADGFPFDCDLYGGWLRYPTAEDLRRREDLRAIKRER